jgi:hypothetical protein
VLLAVLNVVHDFKRRRFARREQDPLWLLDPMLDPVRRRIGPLQADDDRVALVVVIKLSG